jgi:hypothetical protein
MMFRAMESGGIHTFGEREVINAFAATSLHVCKCFLYLKTLMNRHDVVIFGW